MKIYTRILLIVAILTGSLALVKAIRKHQFGVREQFLLRRDFPLEQIAQISLHSKQGKLTLRQAAQGWTIDEEPKIKVDLTKLQMFLGDLYRAHITRLLPGESLEKLGLTVDSGAVTVELQDAQGVKLDSVLLGRVIYVQEMKPGNVPVPRPVGRYVLYHNQPAMLPEALIMAEAPPAKWGVEAEK